MNSSHIFTTVIVILLAATTIVAVDATEDTTPEGSTSVLGIDHLYDDSMSSNTEIDRSVNRALAGKETGTELDLIIQFYPPLDDEDIKAAEKAGLEVVREFGNIPAIHAKGDVGSVESIARYPGTYWIENNDILEYQMEKTTSVINATTTWESPIIDSLGKEYPAIDGRGVTVVVLDSGIDAGHPDLDLGEKVIKNYKSDSGVVWREVENGDTSSGHGTHCAGTVAGNGDASGGARKGVAPGAKLIGLSVGEGPSIINALGGMEWVYEHSKPGHTYEWENPIRVVSNSWGPAPGDYDPQDSITKVSQQLTFDNNVLVIFAASNSGGEGEDIQTNPYGNVPSNIAVAAFERDGSGIASFSSRGELGVQTTYPDIGAPGVSIWSTAARRTFISLMTKQGAGSLSDIDPYYFAISGTSMATPHVAGVTALILQAYPELGMSDVYEEADQDKIDNGWYNDTYNRVHEVELILEASARYVEPSDSEEPLASNNIPHNQSIGWNGQPYDFAQGFGLVQVDKAIALTLTLKELRERDFDKDGMPDFPDATISDAIEQYLGIMKSQDMTLETNGFYASWDGEWSRFSNQTGSLIPTNHDTSKLVYIPEGAESIRIDFTYDPWNTDEKRMASLYVNVDYDNDGIPDFTQSGDLLDDYRTSEISISGKQTGVYWSFNVEGRGIDWNLGSRLRDTQFKEVRTEFTISLNMTYPQGDFELGRQNHNAGVAQWKPLDRGSSGTSVNITRNIYDLGEIQPLGGGEGEGEGGISLGIWFFIALIALIIAGILGYLYYRKSKDYKEAIVKEELGPTEESA